MNTHISKGENIEISGFPGDKSDNRQYKGKGKLESFDENEMYYTVDTFSGQSGSAIRDSKTISSEYMHTADIIIIQA